MISFNAATSACNGIGGIAATCALLPAPYSLLHPTPTPLRVVAQRGKNSSSTPREMRRGGPLARGVDSMDGAAPASEWICEWCGKGNSAVGRFCTGCCIVLLPTRPRPQIPEAQNSAPASSSSGVASADQTAARCTEEPTCLTEEQRAPQRLFAKSKARASNRILESRARPTRRRSRSRSRADSMIAEPPLSPVSARGGRPAVGTHGTAAIEALIDLAGEAPPLTKWKSWRSRRLRDGRLVQRRASQFRASGSW